LPAAFVRRSLREYGVNVRRDFWIGSERNCKTFLREYNEIRSVSSVLSHSMVAVAGALSRTKIACAGNLTFSPLKWIAQHFLFFSKFP
jgi:hypothetical protein